MVIIINKDLSIAQVTPSTVYQGSNLASELTVFAPFSVSSYPAILCNFLLPSGGYLPSLIAFYSANQPDGFGAWTASLPASVTALSGTVKVSFAFIGASHTIDESTTPPTVSGSGPIMTTEAAEFTVQATVPALPDPDPDGDIYAQIISSLASILQRHSDWSQDDSTEPDYIANKPPITAVTNDSIVGDGAKIWGGLNVQGKVYASDGAKIVGNADVSGGISVTTDATIGRNLTVNNVPFTNKLDKIIPDTITTTVVYSSYRGYGSTASQGSVKLSLTPQPDAIPKYDSQGALTTNTGSYYKDCVNVDFFNKNIPVQLLYDGSTGVLSLADVNDNILGSVDLPLEMTVSGAEYADGNLVITFTNGETVSIPLEDLILPEWVSNLNNIPSGSENVPPTAEAVKEYAAPVVRNTVTGTAFVVDDYAENINNNYISASSAASVKVYGQNLINPHNVSSMFQGGIRVNGNEITLLAGSGYGIQYDVFIPKGSTVIFGIDWQATSGLEGEDIDACWLVVSGANRSKLTKGVPFVADKDYNYLNVYYKNYASVLTADVKITNLTLSYNISAAYTPFTDMQEFVLSGGQTIPIDLDSFGGYATIISQTPDVPATLQYTRDLSKTIDNLSKKIANLQNAIAT